MEEEYITLFNDSDLGYDYDFYEEKKEETYEEIETI